MEQKIKIYKVRGFSQRFEATGEFIRQNIKIYFQSYLKYVFPFLILVSVISVEGSSQLIENMLKSSGEGFIKLGAVSVFVIYLLNIIQLMLSMSIGYGFFRVYQVKNVGEITTSDVWEQAKKVIWKIVGVSFLVGAILAISFFLFVIPSIYMAVACSMAIPIVVLEDSGASGSISRSFNLISGHWWSTFGYLFIMFMLTMVVSLVFSLPNMLYQQLFLLLNGSDTIELITSNIFYKVGATLLGLISLFGSTLAQIIFIIAVVFQYGNLVEHKESKGLMGQIDAIHTDEGHESIDAGTGETNNGNKLFD